MPVSNSAIPELGSDGIPQKPRRSSRSHSFSSASIVTVKRPGSLSSTGAGSRSSIAYRSQSPVDNRALARSSHESKLQDHQRSKSIAADTSDQSGTETTAGLNRWSHSTTSSATSASNYRRHRSSSGAVLSNVAGQQFSPRHKHRPSVEHSTRSSPHKKQPSRANSSRQAGSPSRSLNHSRGPSRIHDLSDEPSDSSSLHHSSFFNEADDIEPPSTFQPKAAVVSSILPPSNVHSEYPILAGDESPRRLSKSKRPLMTRNVTAPTVMGYAHLREQTIHDVRSDSDPDRHAQSYRKTRTRDKSDKDKKVMLSKALEKANTAVLLDNAQNIEGALEAYGHACALLMQVMERTSGDDDRRKLGAISETYSNRIMELSLLAGTSLPASEEKNLPARPPSDGSASSSSLMPIAMAMSSDHLPSSQVVTTERLPAPKASFAPRLSYHKGDRDSFFSKTMAAVQDSMLDQDDFVNDGPMFDHPANLGAMEDDSRQLRRTSVHLPPPEHAQYMPRPLTPRRPQSPQLQPEIESAWLADPEPHSPEPRQYSPVRGNSHEPATWLDTIDESGSSRSSSVHSLSSQDGLRRKHIRGLSGDTDAEFDAAFDAAVEAAYNEGYEPDLESHDQQISASQYRANDAPDVKNSDIREISPPKSFHPSSISTAELSDEEEERLLDEITQDFASGLGFNFDAQTKSALPRQSDSSGYSRSTWQSSQISDRATATTSLSTVAEDDLATNTSTNIMSTPTSISTMRAEPSSISPPSAPPKSALPQPPSSGTSTVRSRRLSGQNPKQLKIETTVKADGRKRASTFHHTASPFAETEENSALPLTDLDASLGAGSLPIPVYDHLDLSLRPLPTLELHTMPGDVTRPATASAATDYRRPSYEEFPGDLQVGRPTLFRKNKSSASLREHSNHTLLLASPDLDSNPGLITPMSSTFATFVAKRNQNPLTSQRANFPPFGPASIDGSNGNGIYLFDTSLSAKQEQTSPRIPPTSQPANLEPCPESLLLRPFWLMRTLATTLLHPQGGYLTTKLFIPREVWQTRGVKLKLVEDKIANCDLLTAALGRLASVDSFDVDAVMDELQSFEEVVERVQAALGKRLGNDVGVHGAANFFKDATVSSPSDSVPVGTSMDKATKSNSGKSYKTTWRKIRNKTSGAPLSSTGSSVSLSRQQSATSVVDKDHPYGSHSMPSVPMTSFVPVERRGQKRDMRNLVFEGPHKEYMGSLARLFDGVQVLDQIARQVEDPGLKHSSPTHVGLELSTRHASEFFAFYICRFVLTDLGTLLEKFLKKGTEWVLA